MAFDEDRGVSLAQLVHAAACGDAARDLHSGGRHVYRHGFVLEVTLRAQRLSGRFSADEVRYWRHWLREARGPPHRRGGGP